MLTDPYRTASTYIGWPYIPGSTTYRRTLTDERGKTSSVDKETWIGAVKKVTNAEGKEVTFEYTDNANPHYLKSRPMNARRSRCIRDIPPPIKTNT